MDVFYSEAVSILCHPIHDRITSSCMRSPSLWGNGAATVAWWPGGKDVHELNKWLNNWLLVLQQRHTAMGRVQLFWGIRWPEGSVRSIQCSEQVSKCTLQADVGKVGGKGTLNQMVEKLKYPKSMDASRLSEPNCNLRESKDKIIYTCTKLKNMYTNARSMTNKMQKLELLIRQVDFDFMGISETWFDS